MSEMHKVQFRAQPYVEKNDKLLPEVRFADGMSWNFNVGLSTH